jgi:hypothetical protein
MRRPIPGRPWAKKKSPTTAPMTASPAAMRSPANVAGSAAGSCSLVSRVHRLAPWRVKRSCMAASADLSPNRVLAMIGKSAMRTQTMTRAVNPNPNQNPSSGTSARIGMVCSTTA